MPFIQIFPNVTFYHICFIIFLYIYVHKFKYLHFLQPFDKLQTGNLFTPKYFSECIVPKSKYILLYNHHTIIKTRTLILI